MPTGETWEHLGLYESSNIVRRFYRERHGRTLSAEKARSTSSPAWPRVGSSSPAPGWRPNWSARCCSITASWPSPAG